MGIDLDRYYTPLQVARRALEQAELPYVPRICVDTTCGTGQLLSAANDVFGSVHCMGIDRDLRAIARLRRSNPEWVLAVADLLSKRCYTTKFSSLIPRHVDLLVLNPPFSLGNVKSVDISYAGNRITGSIAMAHLLRSFELFKPAQGAVVIAPESLLYSETDCAARQILEKHYSLCKIGDLQSCTFKSARAHTSIVQIVRTQEVLETHELASPRKKLQISIARGGLPVHLMRPDDRGVAFVHSTDIRRLVTRQRISEHTKTASVAKGRVSGFVILIPRVGVADREFLACINLQSVVQLSDCVIALKCPSKAVALSVEQRIRSSWEDFRNLYKGTGARYVTMARLRAWLAQRSIFDKEADASL